MTPTSHIWRLGTRRSRLALAQSSTVAAMLERTHGVRVELVEITTAGDRSTAPLTEVGGTGVFVGALRQALLAGTVDLAVHSYKDLPTFAADGLVIGAVPPREDPRDALVARDGLTLGELPAGSRIGTGSPRRAAQLHALGLGLDVVPVRGNVDTRVALVSAGTLDAVVVARAGLARLDRLDAITETIDPLQMLPAPAQGALAVEVRAATGDPDLDVLHAAVTELDDAHTRAAVEAERAVLITLEAGCSAPLGALAEIAESDDGFEVYLRAVAVAPDGSHAVRCTGTGPIDDAAGVGSRVALELLDRGAAELVGVQVAGR